MTTKNTQQSPVIPHKWPEHEKSVNCKICTLAACMKNCTESGCAFYVKGQVLGIVNTTG